MYFCLRLDLFCGQLFFNENLESVMLEDLLGVVLGLIACSWKSLKPKATRQVRVQEARKGYKGIVLRNFKNTNVNRSENQAQAEAQKPM